MNIPLADLKAQYKSIKKELDKAVHGVMDSQHLILGEEVRKLESSIASFCGVKYAIGLNSGTDALIIGLKAIGVKEGDEVITTAFSFIATAEAIALVGAKPVFVDIDPATYNIDPDLIEEKITPRTRAILPVHLYGLCADMDPIMRIAKKHNLKVLEDCAQAIGSTYRGKLAGSFGDAGAISFFPSKNLGAFGDGGMLVTNDETVAKMTRLLHNHGSERRYYHDAIGYNSRLDNLQAAVLNVKLKYLDKWLNGRIKNAEFFNKALKKYPLKVPVTPEGFKHTFHLYILRTPKAAKLSEYLVKNGIDSRAYYPIPLHLQNCFDYLGYKKGDLPESERASVEVLNIPAYPELTSEMKKYIIQNIDGFFRKAG